MFNLSIIPIIYTHHLGEYLTFLGDVFNASVDHIEESWAEITLYHQRFKLIEIPKKRTKLNLDFELVLHVLGDLETIRERAEFYYYRHGQKHAAKVKKISVSFRLLTLIDPDKREINIECKPDIKGKKSEQTLNHSYN